MPAPNAFDALQERYLTEAIETASPATRLVMLYDRLELDLRRADAGFDSGDLEAINDHLIHAQEILLALAGTLDLELWQGGAQLYALYHFLHGQLVEANCSKQRQQVQSVAAMVAQLARAWRAVQEQSPDQVQGQLEVTLSGVGVARDVA